jgi:hypothetical protein
MVVFSPKQNFSKTEISSFVAILVHHVSITTCRFVQWVQPSVTEIMRNRQVA